MSLQEKREQFLKQIDDELAGYPDPPPLEINVVDRQYRSDRDHVYEKWKIEYRVETEETMPESSGRKVRAFLLIPSDERYAPPYPAMIAFHQCNTDCTIAKDAVVGRAVQRPDQAYGYELVIKGFVVLAPDAINCGERHNPAVRQPYENKHSHRILSEPLGRPFWFKQAYDGIRGVDVLDALEFVDSDRIGVIGHSMGSAQAANAMARDPRVRVGLVTGRVTEKNLFPIAPRYLMTVLQSLEKDADTIERIRCYFEEARREFHEPERLSDHLSLLVQECGHCFPFEYKLEAYSRLRIYFNLSNYNNLGNCNPKSHIAENTPTEPKSPNSYFNPYR
ncbi:MAG: hypothetical protein J4F39_13905 [Candidatus Latescibacteria bacterium]|nr:hypothetical protein [Candidatus Latescibacterota bacterium]